MEAAFPVDSPSTVAAAALENGGSDDEEEATSGELLLGRWRFLLMFVEVPPPYACAFSSLSVFWLAKLLFFVVCFCGGSALGSGKFTGRPINLARSSNFFAASTSLS